jgi:hypothetical protein
MWDCHLKSRVSPKPGYGFSHARKTRVEDPHRSAEGWSAGAAGTTDLPSFAPQ